MAATSLISSSSLCFSSSSSSWSSRSNSSGGGETYGVGCFSTPSSYKVKRAVAISCSLNLTPATATTETTRKPPQIELEFIGPKATEDGSYPVERTSAISGEKLLRNIMLDDKIELYAAYGKVMNCGGGGSCGTCIVEIIDGQHLLNERTDTEKRYLKKKPDSWRLACQTIVGNKENAGKVVVQRMPQWKK